MAATKLNLNLKCHSDARQVVRGGCSTATVATPFDSRAERATRVASRAPRFAHLGAKTHQSNVLSLRSNIQAPRTACRSLRSAVVSSSASDADRADTTVLIVGSTGYIGRFVVKEFIERGYKVIAMARSRSGVGGKKSEEEVTADFPGAHKVVFGDVTSPESVKAVGFAEKVDVVVSCLASRTGGIQDSWDIDYQATLNVLDAARAQKARQFILLSAICVQKPTLTFQKAKLKFEAALAAAGDITYSIVRPTAFMKSLAGQVSSVASGGPYVMFGDGQLAACKPISEADLAAYMADCVEDPALQNQILPIGGPDEALTALQQSEILFKLLDKEPRTIKVPIQIMDGAIGLFDFLARFFPGLADSAEFAKIGKYYAAESMLVMDPASGEYDAAATPSYGKDTLESFFKKCIEEGMEGQELGDAAVFGQK